MGDLQYCLLRLMSWGLLQFLRKKSQAVKALHSWKVCILFFSVLYRMTWPPLFYARYKWWRPHAAIWERWIFGRCWSSSHHWTENIDACREDVDLSCRIHHHWCSYDDPIGYSVQSLHVCNNKYLVVWLYFHIDACQTSQLLSVEGINCIPRV